MNKPNIKRFEYHAKQALDGGTFYNYLELLNQMGKEGWEFVERHQSGYIVFKREILDEKHPRIGEE